MADAVVELRSDTFTLPTRAMIGAISAAELGNDDYGEDPTVSALESRAADLLGKESSCLMPSGTMANLTALLAHAPRGSKAIVGVESDIFVYEAGGASVCGGVIYHPVPNLPDGTLDRAAMDSALTVDADDAQFALPSVVCLETPQNRCGGIPLKPEYIASIRRQCDDIGIALHLDAARIVNASVALDVTPGEIANGAHTVQTCLSKGVGAPIGSILAGDAEFVARARRIRKMLGGTMKQAGLVAAPALVALDGARDRAVRDHQNAVILARELSSAPGISVSCAVTNIVLLTIRPPLDPEEVRASAAEAGVRLLPFGHDRLRAMTHAGVSTEDVERAAAVLKTVLSRFG